jgi:hypothetical protein
MVSKAVATRPSKTVRVTKEQRERMARLASGETRLVEVRRLVQGDTLQGYGGDAVVRRVTGGTLPHSLNFIEMESGWAVPGWPEEKLEVCRRAE